MQRADAGRAKDREEVAEARVVVQVEAKPDAVDEDELSRYAELQLVLLLEEVGAGRGQVFGRLDDGGVLQRVQTDGPQCGVERDDERLSGTTDVRVAPGVAGG